MADAFRGFPKETLAFLAGVEKNNRREWFEAHRDDYEKFYVEPARAFVLAMAKPLRAIGDVRAEPKTGGSMMRIYRDTRFSKDKRPYKPHLDLWFWEGEGSGKESPGFWFRLQPKTISLGAGMHAFGPDQLADYRSAVDEAKRGGALAKAIAAMKTSGHAVGGEEYKRVPKGFAADHPRGDLLKHTGLYVYKERHLPKELHTPKFVDWVCKHYAAMRPVHEWLVALV